MCQILAQICVELDLGSVRPLLTLSLDFENAYPDAKKAKKSACIIKYVLFWSKLNLLWLMWPKGYLEISGLKNPYSKFVTHEHECEIILRMIEECKNIGL